MFAICKYLRQKKHCDERWAWHFGPLLERFSDSRAALWIAGTGHHPSLDARAACSVRPKTHHDMVVFEVLTFSSQQLEGKVSKFVLETIIFRAELLVLGSVPLWPSCFSGWNPSPTKGTWPPKSWRNFPKIRRILRCCMCPCVMPSVTRRCGWEK